MIKKIKKPMEPLGWSICVLSKSSELADFWYMGNYRAIIDKFNIILRFLKP